MSNLNISQKRKLEKLLEMEGGYVLDFSNASFKRLIFDAIKIDIYNEKYSDYGDSKAKRLRCFWHKESNLLVANLLECLLEYYSDEGKINEETLSLYQSCKKIVEELKENNNDIEILNKIDDDNFELLLQSIEHSIRIGEPVLALDRLHTYMIRYIKKICKKHEIICSDTEPLNSCFGKYIKFLNNNKLIESEMSKVILKNGISIMDKFNYVRNNKSFAHDNDVLNNNESMFIYRTIVNIINFIDIIEK